MTALLVIVGIAVFLGFVIAAAVTSTYDWME